jgi:hypothetical protein
MSLYTTYHTKTPAFKGTVQRNEEKSGINQKAFIKGREAEIV